MINGLIEIFERLKASKEEKFTHSRVGAIDTPEKLAKVKELLSRYNEDVFALCDLESYFYYDLSDNDKRYSKKDPPYMYMVITMLLYYKYSNNDKMDKAKEEVIRNDEHVIEALVKLEDRVAKGVESQVTYAPVLREIEELDFIISTLKELDPNDYLEPDIIKLIYDYLMTETHISYQEKYIRIGKMIAKHNIYVNKKRARI